MPDRPTIAAIPSGPFQTNCHVVHFRDGGPGWIVDAGFEPGALLDYIAKHGLTPDRLILTHAHIDHMAGVGEVRARFPGLPIAIHPAEARWLSDPSLNLSEGWGMPITAPGPDETIDDGDMLELDGQPFEVRHVPGHSPGSIALVHHASHQAIAGDALFRESVGRTDFPTSDPEALVESIGSKLYSLPDETVIYPGHGPTTTIGHEARHNPFVRRG